MLFLFQKYHFRVMTITINYLNDIINFVIHSRVLYTSRRLVAYFGASIKVIKPTKLYLETELKIDYDLTGWVHGTRSFQNILHNIVS